MKPVYKPGATPNYYGIHVVHNTPKCLPFRQSVGYEAAGAGAVAPDGRRMAYATLSARRYGTRRQFECQCVGCDGQRQIDRIALSVGISNGDLDRILGDGANHA